MDADEIRRRWLGRLGRPTELDFAFFASEDVFALEPGRTVAIGELRTGRIVAGEALEAVGLSEERLPVRVLAVEEPLANGRGVAPVAEGRAGRVLALTLEHASDGALAAGQCLAPPGRLALSRHVTADVWLLPSDELPGSPVEQRHLVRDVAAGHKFDLFFHTRPVVARTDAPWQPELGTERRLGFALERPVALYPETRFALRYDGLTFGAGFVIESR